jgi:hypothetical protein
MVRLRCQPMYGLAGGTVGLHLAASSARYTGGP